MSGELKSCPFCGEAPFVRPGLNGYAHCQTPGCWANRCQTVSLEDQAQISAWNRRALLSEREVGREEIEAAAYHFFTCKYVQRSDARQQAMGLQYTEAETHDLAKETAGLFLSLLGGE